MGSSQAFLIEIGVAHGGSLVFYASLCKAMGCGRVIGTDIDIRPHNRQAIETHELFDLITLVEGDSISERTFNEVRGMIRTDDTVMVVLDGDHSRSHVLRELELYGQLVTVGSYIVACDGIRELVVGGPRTSPDWTWNHPKSAALEFVQANPNFRIEEPAWPFNEGLVTERVTYWPSAFIRRLA
jgi:cephalosporin hydroxylase